ncbi:MAG: hypothetical protein IIA87_02430 [Nanoarchaeota archaeon]|nr:hypothetical protein [Nanoarchaeota archaeon]
MYLKRAKAIKKLPIRRKGTKYVARASSHIKDGVPVVIAVRDMLGLAKTAKEVKEIIKEKLIKINGKIVKNPKESIRLFNVLEIGKKYRLTILPTGKFSFEEIKDSVRLCKIINKKILRGKKIQLNFHDGTNILSNENINIGDSIELDFDGKIRKVISFEKGKNSFVISGRSVGLIGVVKGLGSRKVIIKFKDSDKEVELDKSHVIVI